MLPRTIPPSVVFVLCFAAFALVAASKLLAQSTAEPPSGQVSGSDIEQKKVQLAFRDQEWLPALKWLATELQLNLDWQSLPEGTFNLHSTQEYSLVEAEDLVNLQLLGRGFTLLKRGEVLRVVPLKDIDVTLVPHVSADELASCQPHQFVRVSFSLEWMIAEEAAKEFSPLMSPFGKLFPMVSSNRLEAMDAVVNLREVQGLLTRAENDEGRRERIAEFPLKYRKAEEIAIKVRQLVGLSADSTSSSTPTQLDIEQARFKVEAVKQMGAGAKELISEKKAPSIYITINDKENSILVNAPPNKIEIVRQAIEAMDKPLPDAISTWDTIRKVKVHEVDGFDPDTVSKLLISLQERGNLAKETRIQHEAAYNRLIVFASPEDHLTISQVVDSFRAEKRSAAVLQLSALDPMYAAKSVQLILKAPDRPSSSPGVASDGKFQIESDPDHKRLLLWATPDEVTEVREFLIRLGESFAPSSAVAQMHIIPLNGGSLDEVSSKMKKLWRDMSDSPLIFEEKDHAADQPVNKPSTAPAKPLSDTVGEMRAIKKDPLKLISTTELYIDPPVNTGKSPVRVVEGENGELIVLSRDPIAAESAKRLIEQLTPSSKDVRVFQLKHAQAYSVRLQLETMLQHTLTAPSSKLSTSSAMKIDIDNRTNRLLVQHANPKQIGLISELIPIIDQPTSDDNRLVRTQRIYRFEHRRASDVVDLIKDVYRDLLNVNDRSFSPYRTYGQSGYNQNVAATATNPEYQGLLSVGVDREANALVLSAPSYLIDNVVELMKSIDTPIDGTAVAVIPFGTSNSPNNIKNQEALQKLLGRQRR